VAVTLLLMGVAACADSLPATSPSVSGVIETAEQAALAAERLTTIAGPWRVDNVAHDTYESLWQGSTNDPTGQGAAESRRKAPKIVWRVDLSGPSGLEELYIDETDGKLLDAITQGN
jgi:hypothetical protein